MKSKLTYVTIGILVCLTIGFLASVATQSSVNTWYTTLNKPALNPPNWVFAPVWTVLYIFMGISAGWVWAKGFYHKWVKTGLYHFGFQLLLNALWSIIFFGLRQPFLGLLIIITLLIVLLLTIKWFKLVSKLAAILLVPYVLWVCFATYLNYSIWILN
ncbi:TspO/MBR family protein [Maribacter confluentis]|uniref:TspO and MBR related proteins n=2 Tax=Maribacter TaxID=252356 RepID=A0ABY1SHS4_9FLAO|nr:MULTISPECIES: TspO/MBR family protein [Maribacter]MDO1512458.1 TspO/MBR family protein [Maribacter confluentis]TVZ15683.1 TspO/MBR related protein [Maribacter sp. MAR_2009_72]SNR55185.1 TspO and MBR related proteins [Maribacter sedimenticola]